MNYKIVADSCCGVDAELAKELRVTAAIFIMTLGDKYFTDDENLNW